MNSIPETVYESYCDSCGQPKMRMTEMKLPGKKMQLHYCSDECMMNVTQKIKDICISVQSFPSNLEFEHCSYTNKIIYPQEQLKNPDKMQEIMLIYDNFEKLQSSGLIKKPISQRHQTILVVMANWFPVQ
jgi:hypothetical protein